MTEIDIYTVVGSMIAALSSTKAWEYWKSRSAAKRADENLYRDDLRTEVANLRNKLSDAHDRRDREYRELNAQIQELIRQVSELKTQVLFLEQENQHLKQAH